MAWFDRFRTREESYGNALAEPRTVEEVHAEQNWPMLVALAIFALAFAVLIALGAKWAYHRWHSSTPKTEPTSVPAPPPTNLQPSSGL